jgi:hypothetical protein
MTTQYTQHAKTRMQQRSIPPMAVDLLMQFGAETRTHGGYHYYFNKKSKKFVKSYFGQLGCKELESLLNVYAIVSDDGTLITTGHRTSRIKK